jgi:hypothetical protein
MNKFVKIFSIILGCTTALFLVFSFFFWIFCLNHINRGEVGIAYNSMDGSISLQKDFGWHRTSVFTKVCIISTLPFVVDIQGQGNINIRTISSRKAVRFNPDGYKEFIEMHGFSYYNSWNIYELLRVYAFSGKSYPFLEITEEQNVKGSK